jgi:Zn-finger protein
MVDRIRALQLAGRLVMAFPGRNVTDDHAGAWADALESLNDGQASRVVELLTRRSVDPPSVAQIGHTIAEVKGTTMSPDYYGGGYRCTFLDGVECPVCYVVHGHLLTHAQFAENMSAMNAQGKSFTVCRECLVVHDRYTHDEHIARTRGALEAMGVGKR